MQEECAARLLSAGIPLSSARVACVLAQSWARSGLGANWNQEFFKKPDSDLNISRKKIV